MQKSNKLHILLILFFCSCNFKSETGTELVLEKVKNKISYDTVELNKTQKNHKQNIKVECIELQGTWKMFKYIPTMNDNQKLDTNVNLQIADCKLIKTKYYSIIDSTALVLKYENKRSLFYWRYVQERYIRYVPENDILILNKKGFDGGIEYYERKNK